MYGGQQQGGISTPSRHTPVLLFTSDSGEQYGYNDRWQANGLFFYSGEGQHGHKALIRGTGRSFVIEGANDTSAAVSAAIDSSSWVQLRSRSTALVHHTVERDTAFIRCGNAEFEETYDSYSEP